MRTLSAQELLSVWEQGLIQQPVQRALTLLAVACPETLPKQLAELSIGQRDGLLLTLREWTFGSQIQSLATCPNCGDRLELLFSVADIRVSALTQSAEALSVEIADYMVQFRLPNSLDLLAIAASANLKNDQKSSQKALLERCLVNVCYHEETQSIKQLPPDVVNAVITQMAKADPQADIQLNLSCPACGHQWQSIFDIVSFFWSELHAWAIRVLREVHILASAYGWREADILAMSSYRRQLYLGMVGK
ncbi:phage baseplate protein [Scytonema hofmannii PCC 7110]|uniref:Phage baseplate protein n=1 Tax=Scytonema hofmannii PCC 7110 TaxID=128403 RepID=A0A139WXX4_9CYAN|nr:hypothetical protein [Scytonema hofmannii]KYC37280.1 phage baseplate protein [Scytonema hofmannii PCC 7110]